MAEFVCVWEIDVSADSPEEAALECEKIRRDPQSLGGIYVVKNSATGEAREIDTEQLLRAEDA